MAFLPGSEKPTELAGRRVRLTIGIPRGGGLQYETPDPKMREDPTVGYADGLTMSFSASKSIRSTLNSARMQVMNLAPAARNGIRDNVSAFQIEAGYGELFGIIFKGYVTDSRSTRNGPDIVTEIESADGYDVLQETEFKKTFPKRTPVVEVLRQVAKATELPLVAFDHHAARILSGAARARQAPLLKRSLALSGRIGDVLDQLAATFRFEWSIQDGALLLVSQGEPIAGDTVVLTPETGLIGSPSKILLTRTIRIGDKEKVEVADGASFRCLLNPNLRPGGLVELKPANAAPGSTFPSLRPSNPRVDDHEAHGIYRLESVDFDGDTHSGDFVAECEARLLPTAVGF